MWLAVAQALTMWMADLPAALSKLRRSVLPSMATTCPAVISCSAVIQLSRHFSNSAGLSAAKMALNRSCDGMPLPRSRNCDSQVRFLRPQAAIDDEVIGPGDDGTDGDGDDVDERVDDLASARVGQGGEVILDASGRDMARTLVSATIRTPALEAAVAANRMSNP